MCQTRKLADNGARPRPTVRKYRTRAPESSKGEEEAGYVKVSQRNRKPNA